MDALPTFNALEMRGDPRLLRAAFETKSMPLKIKLMAMKLQNNLIFNKAVQLYRP